MSVMSSFFQSLLVFKECVKSHKSSSSKSCGIEAMNQEPAADEYAADVRQALGVGNDELLILQPTRVVKRKGIEHAIELVQRLGMKAKLVISHASGDEGYDYERRVREYSKMMKVDTYFVSNIINENRGLTKNGLFYKLPGIDRLSPRR